MPISGVFFITSQCRSIWTHVITIHVIDPVPFKIDLSIAEIA